MAIGMDNMLVQLVLSVFIVDNLTVVLQCCVLMCVTRSWGSSPGLATAS